MSAPERRALLAEHLRRKLRDAGAPFVRLRVVAGPEPRSPWLVAVAKRRRTVWVTLAADVATSEHYWFIEDRLAAALALAVRVEGDFRVTVDVSDGHLGLTNALGFSAADPSVHLIPDHDYFNSHGYRELRAVRPPTWGDRSADVVWRGSAHGAGAVTTAAMRADDEQLCQRVRLCLLAEGMPGVDAGVVENHIFSALPKREQERLRTAGIVADERPADGWRHRRFAIDVDGNSNAWSGLFTRLLMGCCVLKVASPNGFRQWYYDRLEPGRHVVPVRADLADLDEKLRWCRDHDAEAQAIAARGRELALELDFAAVYEEASADLARAVGRGIPAVSRLPT